MSTNPSAVRVLHDQYAAIIKGAQLLDLAGEDTKAPYDELLTELDNLLSYLPIFREEVRKMRDHQHIWGEGDYCKICGADGRV